jgi:hypothetical protein
VVRLPGSLLLLAVLSLVGCGGEKHAETTTVASPRPAQPARFDVRLNAPTHTPRVGPKWWYAVRVTDPSGRRVAGRLTVQVVDPLGTAHPATVGTSKRKLVDYPFSSRYRDFAQWPAASRGYRLVFRVTVAAKGARRTVSYWVRPR